MLVPGLGLAQENVRRDTLTGDVRIHSAFRSEVLDNSRTIRVYVPPQYATEPNRKFPVLYMHDGQNLFSGLTSFIPNQEWRADESAEMLIKAGAIEPVIIVGIDNAGTERGNEFLPMTIKLGQNTVGGAADLYGDFLVNEVMPFIAETYRVDSTASKTGLCGSSFGGIVTHYLGLKYNHKFGNLGIVSPSIWIQDHKWMPEDLEKNREWVRRQKVWVDMGGDESDEKSMKAFETYTSTWQGFLKAGKGECRAVFESNAGHNEVAWARRFPSMLQFWYAIRK